MPTVPLPLPAVGRHPHLATPIAAGRVRVDLHSHTMWSGDSTTTPDELATSIVESGIDVLCITDHNAIAGAVELVDRLPCRVVVGEELRTAAGEIIGLFLVERVPSGLGHVEAAQRNPRAGWSRVRPPSVRPDASQPDRGRRSTSSPNSV